MILAVDIGNTSISMALFNKHQILKRENCNSIDGFKKQLNTIQNYEISSVAISSVVPSLTVQYSNLLKKNYNYSVTIIDYKLSQLSLKVKKPETIGVDRICNIYATITDYDVPAIIIDFGTATTYDVVNRKGEFIGGAIATGIETSTKYLIDNAALLSNTKFKFPKNTIGVNTEENIQSGIMYGALEQVKGMIQRINYETKKNHNLILTGGLANLISTKLSQPHIVDIDLTLKGIIYIYESNL